MEYSRLQFGRRRCRVVHGARHRRSIHYKAWNREHSKGKRWDLCRENGPVFE